VDIASDQMGKLQHPCPERLFFRHQSRHRKAPVQPVDDRQRLADPQRLAALLHLKHR
jgi:hypothetical protein